jgi:hypothetical protein
MHPFTRLGPLAIAIPLEVFASSVARAADEPAPPAFGRAGQVVISTASQLNVGHSSYAGARGAPTPPPFTSFYVAPSADVFVVRGLSVGARVAYSHSEAAGDPGFDSLSVGPRVGYNVPLGEHLSVWPGVGLSFGEAWFGTGAGNISLGVSSYVPLLYHPVSHFFVGLGPYLSREILSASTTTQGANSDDPLATSYGVSFTAGGWVAP